MKNKNITAVINLIHCLEIESLRNPEVVANLIRAFGLVCWGPPVFGEDEQFKNHATEMAGIYQTPDQLSKALVYLSSFKINTYLEIGVFQGGNFLFVSEYLKRFNPEIKCLGIDPTNYLNPEIRELTELSEWMRLASVTSDKLAGRKFDLVFIDGDHSAEWVKKDYESVGKEAKICMLHDIQEGACPAVMEFWAALKNNTKKTVKEFIDSPTGAPMQGIGMLHERNFKE